MMNRHVGSEDYLSNSSDLPSESEADKAAAKQNYREQRHRDRKIAKVQVSQLDEITDKVKNVTEGLARSYSNVGKLKSDTDS